ncbi:hypothetical protein IWX64_000876 [Arthrobacter sp. CAN_A212]|uniref:hypothetical protein n=1 Tax=Arthrobacter sp. CAN_A212 TaxID=2787719 RepID=UPI0018CA7447
MSTFFGRFSELELREAMSLATKEATNLGRVKLRQKYGFGSATKFVAVLAGHHFDSKALVAAAAAHLTPPLVLTPDLSWGGNATTRILDVCEISWVETNPFLNVPGLRGTTDQDSNDLSSPKYWWVNQNNNFSAVIEQGSLWAPDLRADGQQGHEDWRALHHMSPGDIVFHYASQQFRAISVIATGGVKADRPPDYLPLDGYRHGTLVLLDPLITDMEVRIDALKHIFPPGVGPINSAGQVGRVYTAPIPRSIGGTLAEYLTGGMPRLSTLVEHELPNRDYDHLPNWVGTTDLVGTTVRRAEQRFLRRSLLSRFGNQCALCGKILPENLLVAAHIKRRSESSEEERLNFEGVAMLACSLGCDALFEDGYITVDEAGLVKPGVTANSDLSQILNGLAGSRCLAFSESTKESFEFHRRQHSGRDKS